VAGLVGVAPNYRNRGWLAQVVTFVQPSYYFGDGGTCVPFDMSVTTTPATAGICLSPTQAPFLQR